MLKRDVKIVKEFKRSDGLRRFSGGDVFIRISQCKVGHIPKCFQLCYKNFIFSHFWGQLGEKIE